MDVTNTTRSQALRAASLWCCTALLVVGCRSSATRAVLDAAIPIARIEVQSPRAIEPAPVATARIDSGSDGDPNQIDLTAIAEPLGWTGPRRASIEGLQGRGPKQLDSEQGPVDLGYAVLVDFGAGEAPYDDAPPPIHGVEVRRRGFSDSLIQLSLRGRVAPATQMHATAAWAKAQEVPILDGLPDARLSWVVVGLSFHW